VLEGPGANSHGRSLSIGVPVRVQGHGGKKPAATGCSHHKRRPFILTGFHGPVGQGQPLAGISLTEPLQQQEPQDDTANPQGRAPPLNLLGNLLAKSTSGAGDSSSKKQVVLIRAGPLLSQLT